MNDNNEKFYLTQTPVKKLLIKFSVPCILGMLVSALYNIVDQIFIGNSAAGTAGIMATTLVYPFTVVGLAIALLIGDGAAALFSISLGSKDEKTSNKCVGNAIVTIILLSIILVILGFVFMEPILNVLGANGYDERCQEFTKQYLTIILYGLPFFMFSAGMSSVIRASGAPTYSMITTVVGAIINLIMDPILIFGFDMGIQGAAIATIAGQIVSACLAAIYFVRPKLIKLNKESFKIDRKVLSKLMQLGISSFITQISIAIITIVANNVVGTIGGENATDAGGALGIVFKVFAIVVSFSVGVAVGGQPMLWAGPISDIGAFIVTVILVSREYKKIKKLSGEEVPAEVKPSKDKERFVISIGREFGSGGKYIGQELAKRLNIKCYDKELLAKVSESYNIDMKLLEKVDEKQKSSYWYGFATNYVFEEDGKPMPISAEDNLFLKQAKVIEELYEKENCVIIGRCSDFILKDKPNVISVFIYASDMNFKLNRKKDLEKITEKQATNKIMKIDKERAEHYKHFTSQEWGDKANYELCLDTSKVGVEETIEILENYIRKRIK